MTVAIAVLALGPVLANELEMDAMGFCNLGVLTGVRAQLDACSELYPQFRERNEKAYEASVFFQPADESLLAKSSKRQIEGQAIKDLLQAHAKGVELIKSAPNDFVEKLCAEFPNNVERKTASVFNASTESVKRRHPDIWPTNLKP